MKKVAELTRSGSGAFGDPNWVWFKYMQWMEPYLARPKHVMILGWANWSNANSSV